MQSSTTRDRARGPAYLALGCVGFIASDPALADAAADADADGRQQIVVTGQAVKELDSIKRTAPLIDTPRSITVVDKQVIKETGSATLVEALRTVPGITFGAAEGGNPIGDRPFIRGFDSQGSTYLDGVRDIGAQSREVFAVEQIQIVRGSDSTLGGRGSAGGTINIVSRLPRNDDFVTGDASYGTADYKRVTADANYRLSDTVAVRLAGVWHDQDVAGRDAIFQKRWGFAPSVTIGLGTPTRLTASYYHLHTDELPDSGLPYTYVCSTTVCNTPTPGFSYSEPVNDVTTLGGVTGKVKRSTFYGLKDRDFRKSNTDQLTFRAEHDFGTVTLRNTSRYSHTFQGYIYTQPDDSQGNVVGTAVANTIGANGTNFINGGYVWRRANTRFGYTDSFINQTDLAGKFQTGILHHSFATGIEYSREKAERGTYVTRGFLNAGNEVLSTGATIGPRCNTRTVARFYCTTLFDPNPNDPYVNYANDTSTVPAPIVKSLPIANTVNDATTKAAYAFDSIEIGERVVVNLGLRYDNFKSTVRPGQVIAATGRFSLGRSDGVWNYQAGVVLKPTPETSVYASFATSATPPNSLIGEGQEQNALGTATTATALAILDALKVEKTKSYEVGAKADVLDEKLSLTLALFKTSTDNARVAIDANTVAFVGERRTKGVEVGFNGRITNEWNVFGGYSYLDARIVDGGFSALTAAAVGARPAQIVYVPSVNTGRQFPQTAKHSFTLWSNYAVTPALTIGGGAFYSSRVFGGYADNRSAVQNAAGVVTVNPATRIIARSVPSYWRFDARIAYRISDALEVSVNGQNLSDKRYYSQAYSSHYATIAPGRSAFATLSVRY